MLIRFRNVPTGNLNKELINSISVQSVKFIRDFGSDFDFLWHIDFPLLCDVIYYSEKQFLGILDTDFVNFETDAMRSWWRLVFWVGFIIRKSSSLKSASIVMILKPTVYDLDDLYIKSIILTLAISIDNRLFL